LTRIIRTLPGTISSLSSSKYCAALHGRTVFFEPASSAVQRLRHSAEVHHKKWVNDFTAFSVVYTTGTVVPSHKSELERFGIVKCRVLEGISMRLEPEKEMEVRIGGRMTCSA
jgi:hypothetical protein